MVTVSGNVDPAILLQTLKKAGNCAELWGSEDGKNDDQLKDGKGQQEDNGKPKKGGGGRCKNMKLPHLQGPKLPFGRKDKKSVKFDLPPENNADEERGSDEERDHNEEADDIHGDNEDNQNQDDDIDGDNEDNQNQGDDVDDDSEDNPNQGGGGENGGGNNNKAAQPYGEYSGWLLSWRHGGTRDVCSFYQPLPAAIHGCHDGAAEDDDERSNWRRCKPATAKWLRDAVRATSCGRRK
ncbi:uncharacterized protein [Elaeis guineensis]|uniref:Prostatic spermine-binding protein-like n=1 Tax=Elaeis guineensis var. tenera TaxID=51953 RepID=A0A6I9QEK8_ELAGV|nr:prostatic spermine-binding protein-like [Elaeis guineensis]